MDLFSDSIYSLVQEREYTSTRENSTPRPVRRFYRHDHMYLYQPGRRLLRSQSRKIWNSYKDTKKSFYSSTMTPPVVTLLNKAASVLPPGRVFIARMDKYKDASDALQVNDIDTLKRLMWNASPYRPDGIVDAKNLLELVTTPNPPHDYEYRETGLNNLLHGVRHGEALSQLLQVVARKILMVLGPCELTFFRMETGSVMWNFEESNRHALLGLMSSRLLVRRSTLENTTDNI